MRNFFDSSSRGVEGRSGLILGGKGCGSFEREVNRRRYTEGKLLGRYSSSFSNLEGKEDSYKVVSSFFETNDALGISGGANSFSESRGKIGALEVE